jgi:uncharacterized cupin superfamily protein
MNTSIKFCIAAALIAGCTTEMTTATSEAALSGTGVDGYNAGTPIDDSEFVDVTSQIPALGGTVLSGDPQIKIRFDAPPDGVTAHGVFEQVGSAKIRIVFPFDEHIQVIHGRLRLTDSAGTVRELAPGDAYFIAQGTAVLWEVLTPTFQKSFFDYTHPAS